MIRTGIGIDMRPFVEGRDLILGGARIEYPRGLAGNFDGDVICHAIIDSLLGAANLGERSELFPDTDAKYKDFSSIKLLGLVRLKLARSALLLENVDVTVVCSEPELSNYKTFLLLNISHALEIDSSFISIKQSRSFFHLIPELKKGIAAFAVSTLYDASDVEPEDEPRAEEEYYE